MVRNEAAKGHEEMLFLANIVAYLPKLEAMLESVNQKWIHEDCVYRFYHQSFKVYGLQDSTLEIVGLLQALAPHLQLNAWFREIVKRGTGRGFKLEDNENWFEITRPMLDAFFHARYFLEMICKYGKQRDKPPTIIPSGW
jgi:hypothetical protein